MIIIIPGILEILNLLMIATMVDVMSYVFSISYLFLAFKFSVAEIARDT